MVAHEPGSVVIATLHSGAMARELYTMFFMIYICSALGGFEEASGGSFLKGEVREKHHVTLGAAAMEQGHAVMNADRKEAVCSAENAPPQKMMSDYLTHNDLASPEKKPWPLQCSQAGGVSRSPADDEAGLECAGCGEGSTTDLTGCTPWDNLRRTCFGRDRHPCEDQKTSKHATVLTRGSQLEGNITLLLDAKVGEPDLGSARYRKYEEPKEDGVERIAAPLHHLAAKDMNRVGETMVRVEVVKQRSEDHDKGRDALPEMNPLSYNQALTMHEATEPDLGSVRYRKYEEPKEDGVGGIAAPLHYLAAKDMNRVGETMVGVEVVKPGSENHDKGQDALPEMNPMSYNQALTMHEAVDCMKVRDVTLEMLMAAHKLLLEDGSNTLPPKTKVDNLEQGKDRTFKHDELTGDEEGDMETLPHYLAARDKKRDEGMMVKTVVAKLEMEKCDKNLDLGTLPEMNLPSYQQALQMHEAVDCMQVKDATNKRSKANQDDGMALWQQQEGQRDDLCLMQRRKRDRSPTPRRRCRHAWSEEQRRLANRARWTKPRTRSLPSKAPTVTATSSTRTFPSAPWKKRSCTGGNYTEVIPDEEEPTKLEGGPCSTWT